MDALRQRLNNNNIFPLSSEEASIKALLPYSYDQRSRNRPAHNKHFACSIRKNTIQNYFCRQILICEQTVKICKRYRTLKIHRMTVSYWSIGVSEMGIKGGFQKKKSNNESLYVRIILHTISLVTVTLKKAIKMIKMI